MAHNIHNYLGLLLHLLDLFTVTLHHIIDYLFPQSYSTQLNGG